MTIKFYKTNEPYGFLNNFKKARMFIYSKWWNNVETPYQSRKCSIPEEAIWIWESKTPREARDRGQLVQMVSDWDKIKVGVMKQCVMAKFLQHTDLRAQLMATGDEELIEDSPVDNFWGQINGVGQNNLGKVLMEVREAIKGE